MRIEMTETPQKISSQIQTDGIAKYRIKFKCQELNQYSGIITFGRNPE
jgi:hypothetical protein